MAVICFTAIITACVRIAMPTKAQLDEFERSVDVVIAALKSRPHDLPRRDRLRIEALLMRLTNIVVANETTTRRHHHHRDERSHRRASAL